MSKKQTPLRASVRTSQGSISITFSGGDFSSNLAAAINVGLDWLERQDALNSLPPNKTQHRALPDQKGIWLR